MKDCIPRGTLFCYWSNLKEHPQCLHGPLLLFGREIDGTINKFYACSACRDRKLCSIYFEYGEKPLDKQKLFFEQDRKKALRPYNHQKLFIQYNKLMSENPLKRTYCYTCEKLLMISELEKHKEHEIKQNLSDYLMTHPSEILKPLENSKKEAQYLFSKKTVKDIINILIDLNAKNVLCIGTPRLHEYITENLEGQMSSLLLDIDGRFHNFFGPLNYCWYNLFNHHFFNENSMYVFKEFLTQDQGENMYLICDPPFGGRVEPISQTIKTISDLHKNLNKIDTTANELKIIFIFPYFMEAIIKEKSNPPNIFGGLKDLKMADYKVEYDNHPLFVPKMDNKQQGSQVRIYTNISLNLIKLPESDGYKYCKKCLRWVTIENKHCKICRNCTSKNGKRYKHCKLCDRCVKPSWQHCKTCNRCSLPNHTCGQRPNIGHCFTCNEAGHTKQECSKIFKKSVINVLNEKRHRNQIESEPHPLKSKKSKY
ncbi:PREDICTED: zinc finger CCHC domain-containing protein 4 [Ceratosolen solmsi marchali]|uniref:Zinc finger CCHC domain-containing protein 4 n=1 Tax=Ceratosolen solmsi marchali TaxID=326594 RepID=A0AAJ7E2M8_9HYME|nr:PREDICTED: zinc finger CCHC domain-containing protein 4 [Ceratosolen solmsi marchali]